MTNTISEESVSSEVRESLAYQTLAGLQEAGIKYCLWKSFDRLEDGIRGDTDFDILMDLEQKPAVFKYLADQGWIKMLAEPWRTFPEVFDFFHYDARFGKYLHMHVHFKLVMGEKMVKSLSLPLESLYLETAVESKGLFHAMPELELCVFVMRLSLKIKWNDYARILRRGSKQMIYRDLAPEFFHIHKRCDRTRLEKLLEHPALSFIDRNLILETFDDLYSLNYGRRMQVKKHIAPYRRYGTVERFFVNQYRCWKKKSFGLGTVFPNKGISFAFCGPDGSGKTTIVDSIEKRLTQHFKVARYYMGGNQTSRDFPRKLFVAIFYMPYLFIRKFFKMINFQPGVRRMEQLNFGTEYYMIAGEKNRRYQNAMNEIKRGSIILFERFPLFPGAGDGSSVGERAYFEKYERKHFGQIKAPDLIFVLQVDAETAVKRKPDHHPDVIREKTSLFEEFIQRNKNNSKVMVLDANSPTDQILETALDRINKELKGIGP